ncbi:MAG: sialate O-acetylesterase [Ferruginibacter sp.]
MKKIVVLLATVCCALLTRAQLKTANIFSDHMVLQRNAPINIWGSASPNEKLVVKFNKQSRNAIADKKGKWLVSFAAEQAGGPYMLAIQGKKDKWFVNDILVGDVWLCSGQSNMEWPLSMTDGSAAAIAASANNRIRHVKVEHVISVTPLDDINKTEWRVASPATSGDFTAAGYYFARMLQKELNVPIGLINSSWGGTHIETWISKSGLQSNAAFINIASQLPETMEQFKKDQLQKLKNDISAFQKTKENEEAKGWEQPAFDDSYWSSLNVPEPWEKQGLPTFDGIVWYRKNFTLTEEQLKNDAVVFLGTIDDKDITYINGVKVGETDGWDKYRRYLIPKALLKKGNNTIAVKVVDTGGGGGFYGDHTNVKLQLGDEYLSLAGSWKARVDVNYFLNILNPNSMPSLLYNAMIAPLLKYNIKGTIWYQGESNADRAFQYNETFPLLISDWRSKFNQPAMPFYFTQLSSFNANNQNTTYGSKWAELREAQLHTTSVSHTGMAVTTDIGDPKDIHPRNKKDVGERLALIALKNEYHKDLQASGPVYKSFIVDGDKIRVRFDSTGTGLMSAKNDQGILSGFMIAGEDQLFHWAKAKLEGNEVLVWNENISHPVAVRYGWMDDASRANLFNKEGLPASPFRTDHWKLITQDVKYSIGQ